MRRYFIGVAVCFLGTAAFAQQEGGHEIHLPEMNIEGHAPEKSGPDHAGGMEKGGPEGNGGGNGASSAAQGGNIPVSYLPADTGTPPLPPPGFQTHKVQYNDGHYDIVSVRDGGATYSIERHAPNGARIGGESGSVSNYPNKGGMMILSPMPVWRCYTYAGPLIVNNAMVPGQPCMAITPMGTFFGTAGA
jgi:hypothetical protein